MAFFHLWISVVWSDELGRSSNEIRVRGLISKFSVACGRNGTDRQFFFVNGRPCSPSKVNDV